MAENKNTQTLGVCLDQTRAIEKESCDIQVFYGVCDPFELLVIFQNTVFNFILFSASEARSLINIENLLTENVCKIKYFELFKFVTNVFRPHSLNPMGVLGSVATLYLHGSGLT